MWFHLVIGDWVGLEPVPSPSLIYWTVETSAFDITEVFLLRDLNDRGF